VSERRSPGPVTGFTLWRWTASLVLSAAAIALFALAVLTWPQVAENADVRRALQEDGTRTTATVTELGVHSPRWHRPLCLGADGQR
jgi:hypothetical protein